MQDLKIICGPGKNILGWMKVINRERVFTSTSDILFIVDAFGLWPNLSSYGYDPKQALIKVDDNLIALLSEDLHEIVRSRQMVVLTQMREAIARCLYNEDSIFAIELYV